MYPLIAPYDILSTGMNWFATSFLSSPPPLFFQSGFSVVRVAQYLVFCVVSGSLCVLLSFFFWPLYCLFYFQLQFLITPLVSFNLYPKIFTCERSTREVIRISVGNRIKQTLIQPMQCVCSNRTSEG